MKVIKAVFTLDTSIYPEPLAYPSEPFPDDMLEGVFDGVNYVIYQVGDALPPKEVAVSAAQVEVLLQSEVPQQESEV